MNFIHKILFRRRVSSELERGAWMGDLNASYSESVAAELEKLKEAEAKRIGELKERVAEKENDTTYSARQERKALEKELETAEAQAKGYDQQIGTVRREAQTFRAQASEKRARRVFFRDIFFKECK